MSSTDPEIDLRIQRQRERRAEQLPLVTGIPDLPGINAALELREDLGQHLRGIAQVLLVKDWPGSTLTRGERELIATHVSRGNACFFCTDSHAAFARELLVREGVGAEDAGKVSRTAYALARYSDKLASLVTVAWVMSEAPYHISEESIARARAHGASEQDVVLTIAIASAFAMYNRLVEGFRARTSPHETDEALEARARAIADHGYLGPVVEMTL